MNDTLTVIISAHPPRIRSGMLQRAINSVMNQTKLPDAVVVAIDHNGEGAAKTKQRALESVTTDWVTVLDSDDEMLPEHLETLWNHRHEGDVIFTWFETVPPGGDPFPSFFLTDPWDPEHPRHTTTVIMARTFLMMRVGYRQTDIPGHPYAEDDWLMTQGLIDVGAKVYHVQNAKTWLYHSHGYQTSGFAGQGDAKR